MADNDTVQVEDLHPVRSRVSWGAIFSGAMVALALYFLLTLLGAAAGLSVSDRIRVENLGTGAAIWAILSTIVALFVGGWVTSQCTVGENKTEAAMHGVIMWGVLFGMLLWLMASGVQAGFNAMVGMANFGQATVRGTTAEDWEAAARRAGVPQETINDWRTRAATAPETIRRTVEDPQNQQAVSEATTRATWWAVLGTLLSMIAAVGGSLMGAGPTFRLLALQVGRVSPSSRVLAGRS